MVCSTYSNSSNSTPGTTNNLVHASTRDMFLTLVHITTQLFQNALKIRINCKWCFNLLLYILKLENSVLRAFSISLPFLRPFFNTVDLELCKLLRIHASRIYRNIFYGYHSNTVIQPRYQSF